MINPIVFLICIFVAKFTFLSLVIILNTKSTNACLIPFLNHIWVTKHTISAVLTISFFKSSPKC